MRELNDVYEVKDLSDINEVNALLTAGWIIINVYIAQLNSDLTSPKPHYIIGRPFPPPPNYTDDETL